MNKSLTVMYAIVSPPPFFFTESDQVASGALWYKEPFGFLSVVISRLRLLSAYFVASLSIRYIRAVKTL